MKAEERDPAHLWDMLEAAGSAVEYLNGVSAAEFEADNREREILRMAVERQLEILGEAARRVSAVFREANPTIPWREAIALRNLISHEYDKVDYPAIYRVVTEPLPELVERLRPLIPPVPPSSG